MSDQLSLEYWAGSLERPARREQSSESGSSPDGGVNIRRYFQHILDSLEHRDVDEAKTAARLLMLYLYGEELPRVGRESG